MENVGFGKVDGLIEAHSRQKEQCGKGITKNFSEMYDLIR